MPKKSPPTGFAQRLKALREAAGLTQAQLAGRADLYPFSVAKLEQGVQEPTWPTVLALARALGVNCLAFVPEGEPSEPPAETAKRGPGRPKKPTEPAPSPDEQADVAQPERLTKKPRKGKGQG